MFTMCRMFRQKENEGIEQEIHVYSVSELIDTYNSVLQAVCVLMFLHTYMCPYSIRAKHFGDCYDYVAIISLLPRKNNRFRNLSIALNQDD